MALAMGDEEVKGRLKRIFSQLATCTKVEEARAVVAFHYYRLKDQGKRDILQKLYDYIGGRSDEEFNAKIKPWLRRLYNFTMYYSTKVG